MAQNLSSVLEEEFAVLETKNLEALEIIQDRKVSLLQQLDEAWTQLTLQNAPSSEKLNEENITDSLFEEAIGLINRCKEAHIRNDLLLKKQLEVVRNVLSAITKKSANDNSDLYNKMGRMGKKR